jgi:hypothetical protein
VIFPAPGDLQILGRKAFLLEATFAHDRDRRQVGWLDIGFEAMQLDERNAWRIASRMASVIKPCPSKPESM